MKNNYYLLLMLLVTFKGFSQIETTTYRGAFAPAPAPAWTDNWTNFDPQNAVYPTPNVDVTMNITANTTWTTGNTYYLKAQIYIKNNATLTIEPGVIVRADNTAIGAGLFVTKGSKLNAIGTATSPIVFTSDKAPGSRAAGNWGGIILLGKGSYNINGGINNIEGIPVSTDTEFGGATTPDDNDNSGTLKYVRIEFGGYVYAPNQEINGLTLGAIGRGTTIDYVQVSFANDDSFEWFGGSVNCKHLIAFRGVDDDFDTDNGYNGNVQYVLGIKDPQVGDPTFANTSGASTSEGFESDNNSSSSTATPFTSAVFTNCTLIGPAGRISLPNGGTLFGAHKRAARLRRNTQLKIFNSLFFDFKEGLLIDGTTTEANAFTNNTMKWKNNIIAGTLTTAATLLSTTAANSTTLANWYAASNNTTVASNANILTTPYNTADAQTYTGLDYRPTATSIAATGADFTDSSLSALLSNSNFASQDSEIVIYPNPSNTTFKFTYNSISADAIEISVSDLTGRNIETKKIQFNEVENTEFGTNYISGIYLVLIKQGQTWKTIKIIKN